MSQDQWNDVDRYLRGLFVQADPVFDAALKAAADAGLPEIQVAPMEGRLLSLLAHAIQARTILEIGTLGGYSAIWLARALPPGGSMITLEADQKHADVARANLESAGLGGVVEVRVGPAIETLPQLAAEGRSPFDLIFIDADKVSYPAYLGWALQLTRPGSLIIADNVVRDGAVADDRVRDANIEGVRRFLATLASDPRLIASAVQTVGTKGYDGFSIALVR